MKFNKPIVVGSLLAISMIGGGSASALQTYTYQVGADIQNAFQVAASTQLSFGTVTANYDDDTAGGASTSTLIIDTDGVVGGTNSGDSRIVSMGGATPAVFTITGANPGSTLSHATPSATTLANANPSVSEVFDLGTYTFAYANNDGAPIFTPVVGADGTLTITMGATLTTDSALADDAPGGAVAYTETTYTGTVTFDISY